MTAGEDIGRRAFATVAWACLLGLAAGVVWASNRGLEITDEAYYLLSAMHPGDVTLYVSAQHWISAPIWQATGSLQAFRLAGAGLLVAAAAVLGLGAVRAVRLSGDVARAPDQGGPVAGSTPGVAAAAGGVGALLYVATIAPSPCYNLFASAGAYAGVGFTLLAIGRRPGGAVGAGLAAGATLAVAFVAKPSAGVASALVALSLILVLARGSARWAGALGLLAGLPAAVLGLAAAQPADPAVLESLREGLALFRVVQTEPVGARLLRYGETFAVALWGVLRAFWPALLLAVILRFYARLWLAGLTLAVFAALVVLGQHFLGGMFGYYRQMEAVYALVVALLVLGLSPGRPITLRIVLYAGLLALPFAVAVGTGNALFTQVIVSLAPWTVFAALVAGSVTVRLPGDGVLALARRGVAALLLVLISVQVLTSYTREPYHLAQPLVAQTMPKEVGSLGRVRVDAATLRMLDDVTAAREACAIEPGAAFLGLYNVPGLAILFDAVPPVSPWLNNRRQLDMIAPFWTPDASGRVVRALTTEAQMDEADSERGQFCGTVRIAFSAEIVEIWASPGKADGG